jgi:hypothetical protein
MKINEILNVLYNLSNSCGEYSRLWFNLCTMRENDPARFRELMEDLESRDIKDPVDLILLLEG